MRLQPRKRRSVAATHAVVGQSLGIELSSWQLQGQGHFGRRLGKDGCLESEPKSACAYVAYSVLLYLTDSCEGIGGTPCSVLLSKRRKWPETGSL